MTRLDYNLQIIDYLKAYANHYPDMRFGQILSNLNIASHILEQHHDEVLKQTRPVYRDIFFPESEETLNTLLVFYPEATPFLALDTSAENKILGDNFCFLSINVSKIPEGVSIEQILDIVKLTKNNG